MTATTLSIIGMIRNSPGPLTPRNLLARRITNFCQLAIFRSIHVRSLCASRTNVDSDAAATVPDVPRLHDAETSFPRRSIAISSSDVAPQGIVQIGGVVPQRARGSIGAKRPSSL